MYGTDTAEKVESDVNDIMSSLSINCAPLTVYVVNLTRTSM